MMYAKCALAPFVALTCCAGAPMPAERLASAESAARGATEVGAEGTPQASLHLKMARDQIAQAKSMMSKGDNEAAAMVLTRAEADAELSLALAKETAARAEANAVIQEAQDLRRKSP
jgi:hypothetical protein